MKRILKLYKPYMNRVILMQTLTRSAIALTALLLWDRLFERNQAFLLLRDGCLVLALFLLAAAWFAYLKLDGIDPKSLLVSRKGKSIGKKHHNKGMMDYVETEIGSYAEMSQEARDVCRFFGDLLAALLFLVASLVGTLVS